MFQIEISENIKLSLDLTLDSFEQIYKDNNDVKSYKLAINNLHNALELTFKFMILNRDEFMIFSYNSNGFNSILKKYKEARKIGQYSLLNYYEKNPTEVQPHTVSFDIAYQILAYLYHIPEFDERFLFQLSVLENLRNKLTHFEANISKLDVIMLIALFEKCIKLYNTEIIACKKSIRYISQKYEKYEKYNCDKRHQFLDLSSKIAEEEILKEQVYKLILGVVIENAFGEMVELDLEEYDRFAEICYKSRTKQFKELYSGTNENGIKDIIANSIYTLIQAYMICSRKMYYQEVDVMGRTSITDFAIEAIIRKWRSNDEICKELMINNIKDIYKEFDLIQDKFEGTEYDDIDCVDFNPDLNLDD